jgi:hypothetical protein
VHARSGDWHHRIAHYNACKRRSLSGCTAATLNIVDALTSLTEH